MMLIEKLVCGTWIHRTIGEPFKDCIYAKDLSDVPDFLLEDGAVKANADGSISMYNSETRGFPIYLCFCKVSENVAHKIVPGIYMAWPIDNGDATLKVVDGKCYFLAPNILATLITNTLPTWVSNSGFPVKRNGNTYELTRPDRGGEVLIGRIGKALWLYHSKNDIDILDLADPAVFDYIVTECGHDICSLAKVTAYIL